MKPKDSRNNNDSSAADTDPLAAALDLQAWCERRGWSFCFIGGLAIQRWGEPRFTKDADMTLLTSKKTVDFISPLQRLFREILG